MAAADHGLRQKLYLFGGGVIVAITVVAALLVFSVASRLVRSQADAELATYVSRSARMVETTAEERRHEAELIALMPLTGQLAATGRADKGVDAASRRCCACAPGPAFGTLPSTGGTGTRRSRPPRTIPAVPAGRTGSGVR